MRFRSWLKQSSCAQREGTLSTPKVHIERRISDALGRSRGLPCRGNTLAATGTQASSLWGPGGPLLLMPPETQRVVQHQIDGLWATGSIIGQRLVAKGWSAGLVTSLTWTGEEPISRSRHRQQTARRPWSFGRYESCAPRWRTAGKRVPAEALQTHAERRSLVITNHAATSAQVLCSFKVGPGPPDRRPAAGERSPTYTLDELPLSAHCLPCVPRRR